MSRDSQELLLGFTQAIALTMSVAFLTYVCLIVVPYLRHRRAAVGDSAAFDWHFLVPCRDEEAVIGGTIEYLRHTFPRAHIWIVDDHSDDATADIVRTVCQRDPFSTIFVHLVTRRRPNARTGKGDALNAGYRALVGWLSTPNRWQAAPHPDNTIVIVVDADGRPAPDCFDVCAAGNLFGDPTIGAVQVDVRMINRGIRQPGVSLARRWLGSALVRMQDLEFRTAIAAIQMFRKFSGTISMGGNGQFTRLSALDSIAGDDRNPWRGSLLEDFELGVHLLTAGWRTGFTVDTYVDQEGLYSLRRFLAQRTRWGQGTMQCARYIRQIWESRHVSTAGAAEMLYYLAQPWMQLLGTLIYPIPLVLLTIFAVNNPDGAWLWFSDGAWILFLIYGMFGLSPFLVWGPIYRHRCERRGSVFRGVGYGFLYALYIYTFYITSWRALFRLIRRRNTWAKTRRNAERHQPSELVAPET